jgi:hypothetical protein
MLGQKSSCEALLASVRDAIESVSRDADALAAGLTPEQLAWAPPGGGWSVAQVLEHLVVADGIYLDHMRRVLGRARAARAGGAAWKPSFLGARLVGALRPERRAKRVPAPKMFRPGPEARPNVLDAFLASQREALALVDRAAGLDLARVRTHSPVSRLIRINLGDCFAIVAVHGQRHIEQMREVRAHPSFPAAGASRVA